MVGGAGFIVMAIAVFSDHLPVKGAISTFGSEASWY